MGYGRARVKVGYKIMNMRMTFLESLVEASGRIDGLVMLGISLLSILFLIITIVNSYLNLFDFESDMRASLIFLPLIEYLIYIKLRVFGSGSGGLTQAWNSLVLLSIPGSYFLWGT